MSLMEVDTTGETQDSFDLNKMGDERALIAYSKTKNIGVMGRCLLT